MKTLAKHPTSHLYQCIIAWNTPDNGVVLSSLSVENKRKANEIEKINLLYMIDDINSNDPEPPTTYVEAGRNLI